MKQTAQVGDLQIDQDLKYQHRAWVWQRIGVAMLVLIILAALLGLFGKGPLSERAMGQAGSPLHLEYERFARFQSPQTLRVYASGEASNQNQLRIFISRSYAEATLFQNINPPPIKVEAAAQYLIYTFHTSSENRPVLVIFAYSPQTFGRLRGRLGLGTGEYLDFEQFVYP